MHSIKVEILKCSDIVLVGASTGGPGLIESIVSNLPQNFAASVVIAQHMDSLSLGSFAKRLERVGSLPVTFVNEEVEVKKCNIYLLSDTSILEQKDGKILLKPKRGSKGFYHPTIDDLFSSATTLSNIKITAILLSGIGADGAKGLLALKSAGHETIAQDEATSIVYGMPKAAAELGAATSTHSIDAIVTKIKGCV